MHCSAGSAPCSALAFSCPQTSCPETRLSNACSALASRTTPQSALETPAARLEVAILSPVIATPEVGARASGALQAGLDGGAGLPCRPPASDPASRRQAAQRPPPACSPPHAHCVPHPPQCKVRFGVTSSKCPAWTPGSLGINPALLKDIPGLYWQKMNDELVRLRSRAARQAGKRSGWRERWAAVRSCASMPGVRARATMLCCAVPCCAVLCR